VNPKPPLPPGPGAALLLTLAAWSLVFFAGAVFTVAGLPGLGLAVGHAVGYGGIGSAVARAVPEPAALRLGLRGVGWRWLLPVLALAPAALVLSELDNLVDLWIPRPQLVDEPDAAAIPTLALIEAALFSALLRPAVEEFFFRGVLQQGTVAALGPVQGVVLVAGLYAGAHATLDSASLSQTMSFGLQFFAEGLMLGLLREASGSILPGIAVRALIRSGGLLAVAFAALVPIPGCNLPGAHTPAVWLVPALASVAAGLAFCAREARTRPRLPDPPPREEDDDVPLF